MQVPSAHHDEACWRFTLARFGERKRDMPKARGRNRFEEPAD
jgi:hypothetical protein